MQGKRILFIVSRFLDGGIDTVLVEYVNGICRLTPHQVTLAICIDYGKEAEVFLSRLDPGVHVTHIVSHPLLTYHKRSKHRKHKNAAIGIVDEAIFNPIRRSIISHRLSELISQHDAVIDFDSCQSAFMPPNCKAKKIAFFHFSIAQETQRDSKRMRRLVNRFARYDHIVTLADAMLQEAVELCPTIADRFCRIYNCINPDIIRQRACEQVSNPRIASPYILAVERLEESQKDITTLINAYALLPQDDTTPPLYIIGEGKSRAQLESQISNKGLQDRILLLGFIQNPYPWIANAQVIVHSSKFEGLPTVLIEALMLHRHIVSTDCPTGPAEILDHGKAGLLTPVGDAQALATAISNTLHNDDLRKSISQHAINHCKNFTPENSVRLLEQLIMTP